jgi:hypothetical protein
MEHPMAIRAKHSQIVRNVVSDRHPFFEAIFPGTNGSTSPEVG